MDFSRNIIDEVDDLKDRISKLELQMGRMTSHIESELGLARRDINRLETRLFGKDDDDMYGGRIGQLVLTQIKFEKVLAWGGGFTFFISLAAILVKIFKP